MGKIQQGWAGILVGLLVGVASPANAVEPSEMLIFFDSGKPILSRDALQTLAASFREAVPGAKWTLLGHADRSGPNGANRRIALARAKAVRDYLVQLGADAAAITIGSSGEDASLVPTGDGVWEPQNRRVEIFIDR